jgi:hypothetical protein
MQALLHLVPLPIAEKLSALRVRPDQVAVVRRISQTRVDLYSNRFMYN